MSQKNTVYKNQRPPTIDDIIIENKRQHTAVVKMKAGQVLEVGTFLTTNDGGASYVVQDVKAWDCQYVLDNRFKKNDLLLFEDIVWEMKKDFAATYSGIGAIPREEKKMIVDRFKSFNFKNMAEFNMKGFFRIDGVAILPHKIEFAEDTDFQCNILLQGTVRKSFNDDSDIDITSCRKATYPNIMIEKI